ncbi:hypothetical protein HYV69_01055 [Candidatus Uhrbacteria bacterium]|nr:hypothetical protein [Candidatus Uhrbacteria bacterium]
MSTLSVIGAMFAIASISALIAAIFKSRLALYIMTASIIAFATVFGTFATFPTDIIVFVALWICFMRTVDESRLLPVWVLPLAITEILGIFLPLRLNEPVGFIIGIACAIALIGCGNFLNDQKALKPSSPA